MVITVPPGAQGKDGGAWTTRCSRRERADSISDSQPSCTTADILGCVRGLASRTSSISKKQKREENRSGAGSECGGVGGRVP